MTGKHRGSGGPPNPCGVSITCTPMNDGTGGTFFDGSGHSNNIVAANPSNFSWASNPGFPGLTPLFVSGTPANAVSTSTSLTNFAPTDSFSIAFWYARGNSIGSASDIVGSANPSTGQGWDVLDVFLGGVTQGIDFELVNSYPGNAIEVFGGSLTGGGATNFVVATYDGSSLATGVIVYINGVSQSLTVNHNSLSSSSQNGLPFYVMQRSNGSFPNSGTLAYMTICSGVMSSAKVTTNYNGGTPIVPHC